MHARESLQAVTVSAVIVLWSLPAAAQRASPASCRQAVNGLISLLDAGKDGTARYRDTYAVVVNTCGPEATAPRGAAPPSPSGRAQCHDLTAAMVDLIEDDKMNSAEFVAARNSFSAACAPK
jgi:hypothetical protein